MGRLQAVLATGSDGMKLYLWESTCAWLDTLVLWDGEHLYWTEAMHPSGGYKKIRRGVCPITRSRYTYIGEL